MERGGERRGEGGGREEEVGDRRRAIKAEGGEKEFEER